MKSLKNLTLVAAFMVTPFVVNAQSVSDDNGFRSYTFVQPQGGLHFPLTSGSVSDLMQPAVGFNIGRWFAPVVGARIGAEGFKSTSYVNNAYQGFNFFNINIDGLFNLLPIFNKNISPKYNFYLIGGFGFNYSFAPEDVSRYNKSHFAHNLRLGAGFEYRIFKPLSVSLEYRVNNTADYFNGNEKGSDDWYSSLMLGISYNFGYSKKGWNEGRFVEKAPAVNLTLSERRDAAVNERMKSWVKRMKGESKADYLARTSEEAIQTQRLNFGREFATRAAMDSNIGIAGGNPMYNAATQALMINPAENMPSIILGVPLAAAGTLAVSNLRFENTKYDITPDNQFEVIYTEAVDVKTGQRYIYNKANGTLETDNGFISLEDYQLKLKQAQLMANNSQLAAQTNAVQKVEEQTFNVKNTTVTRETQQTNNPNGTSDFTVRYKYNVRNEFSAVEDFAVGQFDAEKAAGSKAMLAVIAKQLSGEFAKYIEAGKPIEIIYHGTADAKPINNGIAYTGKYGDIKEQPVTINGKQEKLSVTKAEGITSNKQLSLLRATSVQRYIKKNVTPLKDMKVKESFEVEVFPDEGGQYRRVSIAFIFHDTKQ